MDFSTVFSYVKEPYQSEILDFIDFVKKNPSKESISKYKLSHEAKRYILAYIDYIFKKVEKK